VNFFRFSPEKTAGIGVTQNFGLTMACRIVDELNAGFPKKLPGFMLTEFSVPLNSPQVVDKRRAQR
jgi:hypothetical protein